MSKSKGRLLVQEYSLSGPCVLPHNSLQFKCEAVKHLIKDHQHFDDYFSALQCSSSMSHEIFSLFSTVFYTLFLHL